MQRDQRHHIVGPCLRADILGSRVGMRQYHDATDLEDAKEGRDMLRHIGQQNHHPVARLHALAVQDLPDLIGQLVEAGIGQPLAVKHRGGPPRQRLGCAFKKLMQRAARNGNGRRRALTVQLEPGAAGLGIGWLVHLAPRGSPFRVLDEALDGAVDGLMALKLHFMARRADIHHLRAGNDAANVLKDVAREIGVALAGDDQRRRLDGAHQRPTLPLGHVVDRHAFDDVQLSVPARPVVPDRPQHGSRNVVGQRRSAAQRILTGGGDQHQPLDLLRVDVGILDADRAAEGMPHQHELIGQFQKLRDGKQIGHQFAHGVTGKGGVALAVAAQIGRDDPEVAREVVDLVFPGLGAAGVAMHEDDGAIHAGRVDIDHAQLVAGHARDRDADAIEIEVKLDVGALQAAQLALHRRIVTQSGKGRKLFFAARPAPVILATINVCALAKSHPFGLAGMCEATAPARYVKEQTVADENLQRRRPHLSCHFRTPQPGRSHQRDAVR